MRSRSPTCRARRSRQAMTSVGATRSHFGVNIEDVSIAVALLLIATLPRRSGSFLRTHRDCSITGRRRRRGGLVGPPIGGDACRRGVLVAVMSELLVGIERAASHALACRIFVGADRVAIVGQRRRAYVRDRRAAKDKWDLAVNMRSLRRAEIRHVRRAPPVPALLRGGSFRCLVFNPSDQRPMLARAVFTIPSVRR